MCWTRECHLFRSVIERVDAKLHDNFNRPETDATKQPCCGIYGNAAILGQFMVGPRKVWKLTDCRSQNQGLQMYEFGRHRTPGEAGYNIAPTEIDSEDLVGVSVIRCTYE